MKLAILNYFVEREDGFYAVEFQDEDKNSNTSTDITSESDFSLYLPFVPEGFIITDSYDIGNQTSVTYKNENGEYITYEQLNGKTSMTFDSDRFKHEKLTINEKELSLFSNEDIYYCIYYDNTHSYYMVSNIARGEFISVISVLFDN